MVIKKFQANTETQAILQAKEELGKEAIVMNIKTIKPKGMFRMFRKTQVEVTAAVDETGDKEKATEAFQEGKTSSLFNAKIDEKLHPEFTQESDEAKEAKELDKKLNTLAQLLEQQIENRKKESKKEGKKEKSSNVRPVETEIETVNREEKNVPEEKNMSGRDSLKNKSIDLIIEMLTNNEVSLEYAKQIIEEITHTGSVRTLDDMLAYVYQKIILKLGQTKPITYEKGERKPKVIFFLGPTGVGKTTTIAKLSSRLTLEEKKKLVILTADTYRIAAVEQIKTYAGILSIPVEVVYETKDLDSILPKYRQYDYILIDTAGRSHKNEEQFDDLKRLLAAFSKYSIQAYLVLSATTKYKDLKKITALYDDITDCSLIFTKLDETDAVGNILNVKLDTGMALSYVSYGQNVPDDIEVMNPQVIAKQLLGGNNGYGSGR